MNAVKHRCGMLASLRIIGVCLLVLPNSGVAGNAQTAPTASNSQVQKRTPYHLGMLIEQANWDVVQRGPLLALDPILVYRNTDVPLPDPGPAGYELRVAALGFDRMLVNTGTVSILAPTQMTLINDKPRERPNLYDGLPRDLKVKYLMATLTQQQWKTLGEKGLGVSDLSGEQQPVYLSLLPDPFVVKRRNLDATGHVVGDPSLVTFTPEQRAQVRLRIHRHAQVSAPLLNKPDTYTSAYVAYDRPGEPNGAMWERDTRADQQKTDLFGVNLSSVVPNKPKPSQLDYASSRLNAPVDLQGAATLGDLVARISEVTHLEIYADGRVARLPLLARGERARAGDALKALALGVTGTFRKVDMAFVLTSDLTGIGTRQMRLSEWQWEIKEKTAQLEKELTAQIVQHSGKEGGVRALGYAPNDPYPLTPTLEQEARKNHDIPSESLTPALRQLLHDVAAYREKEEPNREPIRDDTANILVLWRFAFQLPNGAILQSESGLAGSAYDYYPSPHTGRANNGAEAAMNLLPAVRRPLPAATNPRTLFLAPRHSQDAVEMAQTARRLGFTALVLYTEDSAALKAAIAEAAKTPVKTNDGIQSLHVYAAVAPFAAAPNEAANANDLDINLMGETAAQVVAARNAQPRWNRFLREAVTSAGPCLVPERIVGVTTALPPISPNAEAHFRRIAELARTEGLAGLFLYDTQPGGYAGKHLDYIITNDNVLSERENLGYTPALRLAFLRQSGADPLDLTPPHIDVDVDLRLPFFPDRLAANRSGGTPGQPWWEFTLEKGEAWDAFRAETNRKAMTNLFALLRAANPNLPLSVEARAALNNVADAARLWPAWASWTQPGNLLVGTPELHDDKKRPPLAKGERYLFPVQFSASELLPARGVVRETMELLQNIRRTTNDEYPFALDFRYLPAQRALALLNECVAPTPQAVQH